MVKRVDDDDRDVIEIGAWDATGAAEEFAQGECDDDSGATEGYLDGRDIEVKDAAGNIQVFTVYAEYRPTFSSFPKMETTEKKNNE